MLLPTACVASGSAPVAVASEPYRRMAWGERRGFKAWLRVVGSVVWLRRGQFDMGLLQAAPKNPLIGSIWSSVIRAGRWPMPANSISSALGPRLVISLGGGGGQQVGFGTSQEQDRAADLVPEIPHQDAAQAPGAVGLGDAGVMVAQEARHCRRGARCAQRGDANDRRSARRTGPAWCGYSARPRRDRRTVAAGH